MHRIDDLVEQTGRLERSVSALSRSVDQQRVDQGRLRKMNRILTAVVVGLFIAVAGVAVVATLALQNRESARVTCEASNEARDTSQRLWLYLLDSAATDTENPPTEAQRKQLANFRALVVRNYAPRDCQSDHPTVTSPSPTR